MADTSTTQAEPTRPRPTTPEGRTLDAHGLPLNGPARIAALAGRPDPALAVAEPVDEQAALIARMAANPPAAAPAQQD